MIAFKRDTQYLDFFGMVESTYRHKQCDDCPAMRANMLVSSLLVIGVCHHWVVGTAVLVVALIAKFIGHFHVLGSYPKNCGSCRFGQGVGVQCLAVGMAYGHYGIKFGLIVGLAFVIIWRVWIYQVRK